MHSEMTLEDVIHVLRLLSADDISVHVDGGWAVDVLLGSQSRTHGDLDLAVQDKDVRAIRRLLGAEGYREATRDDSWECNFVLGDGMGREVDVHSYTFDSAGNVIHGVPYPQESLTGMGRIAGLPVACISPEWLVRFHSGYELDDDDFRDVAALCARFGIPLPDEYQRFLEGDVSSDG